MKFTLTDLKTLNPCSDGLEWASTQPDAVTAWNTCPRADWLLWLIKKIQPLTRKQSVRLAIAFARQSLPQWVACYPEDNRPQKAIEAAEAWFAERTPEAASAAESAASAASAAAESAESAATWSAWSARSARSARFARSAVSAAARSAVSAATRSAQADIIRSQIPCPFTVKRTRRAKPIAERTT